MGEEYTKQILTVLSQFESDISKAKEEEEGLKELMKKTEKMFQQQRIVQTQRMKTIRKLHEQYMKGLHELDSVHEGQQAAMQSELKKEMALLQKKILMETVSSLLAGLPPSLPPSLPLFLSLSILSLSLSPSLSLTPFLSLPPSPSLCLCSNNKSSPMYDDPFSQCWLRSDCLITHIICLETKPYYLLLKTPRHCGVSVSENFYSEGETVII